MHPHPKMKCTNSNLKCVFIGAIDLTSSLRSCATTPSTHA